MILRIKMNVFTTSFNPNSVHGNGPGPAADQHESVSEPERRVHGAGAGERRAVGEVHARRAAVIQVPVAVHLRSGAGRGEAAERARLCRGRTGGLTG